MKVHTGVLAKATLISGSRHEPCWSLLGFLMGKHTLTVTAWRAPRAHRTPTQAALTLSQLGLGAREITAWVASSAGKGHLRVTTYQEPQMAMRSS